MAELNVASLLNRENSKEGASRLTDLRCARNGNGKNRYSQLFSDAGILGQIQIALREKNASVSSIFNFLCEEGIFDENARLSCFARAFKRAQERRENPQGKRKSQGNKAKNVSAILQSANAGGEDFGNSILPKRDRKEL